jgi:hypothetical protein
MMNNFADKNPTFADENKAFIYFLKYCVTFYIQVRLIDVFKKDKNTNY